MTRVEDYTWLPCHFVHHHRHLLKLTRCESRMQVQGTFQIRWCGQGCLICSGPRTSTWPVGPGLPEEVHGSAVFHRYYEIPRK